MRNSTARSGCTSNMAVDTYFPRNELSRSPPERSTGPSGNGSSRMPTRSSPSAKPAGNSYERNLPTGMSRPSTGACRYRMSRECQSQTGKRESRSSDGSSTSNESGFYWKLWIPSYPNESRIFPAGSSATGKPETNWKPTYGSTRSNPTWNSWVSGAVPKSSGKFCPPRTFSWTRVCRNDFRPRSSRPCSRAARWSRRTWAGRERFARERIWLSCRREMRWISPRQSGIPWKPKGSSRGNLMKKSVQNSIRESISEDITSRMTTSYGSLCKNFTNQRGNITSANRTDKQNNFLKKFGYTVFSAKRRRNASHCIFRYFKLVVFPSRTR